MNYELLRKAIEVIERIPDSKIDLEAFYKFPGDPRENLCGTIACAAGWLALDPEFSALSGLMLVSMTALHGRTSRRFKVGDESTTHSELWADPLSRVFGTDYATAASLFGQSDYADIPGTDKDIWLARAHKLLKRAP